MSSFHAGWEQEPFQRCMIFEGCPTYMCTLVLKDSRATHWRSLAFSIPLSVKLSRAFFSGDCLQILAALISSNTKFCFLNLPRLPGFVQLLPLCAVVWENPGNSGNHRAYLLCVPSLRSFCFLLSNVWKQFHIFCLVF